MAEKVTASTVAAPAVVAEQAGSFVEWSAVFAGALAAAAISFVLYSFGATIGLSLVSPWPGSGLPAALVTALAVFWVMASQIGSFLAGGYIAGRMRSRWTEDNVEFRDGLHGMLVWALGVVIGVALVLTTAASVVRGGLEIGARAAGAVASSAPVDPLNYYIDTLLRPPTVAPTVAQTASAQPATTPGDTREEVRRLLQRGLVKDNIAGPDKAFLAQVVAHRTGLTPQEAEKRVDETIVEAKRAVKETADKARRGAVISGLVTALTLVIAFAAAWWAALKGGQHRDNSGRTIRTASDAHLLPRWLR